MMNKDSKIFVAGHLGLVGSSLVRTLKAHGFSNLLLKDKKSLNLIHQNEVQTFFQKEKPEFVFLAAAKVGGILYNQTYQADFLYENMMIALNVLRAAADSGVRKLLYLGSSCIYPKEAPQPLKEEYLLTGPLEPTNEAYALAKITGLKFCEKLFKQEGKNFISAMPTNLYGPGDNYHPHHSHVIPGLMRRFHEAKIQNEKVVQVWGTGAPRREFLFVDDLSEGLLLLMEKYEEHTPINIGTGIDITIHELSHTIKEVIGFKGEIVFDASKPDGTMRKVLDISKIKSLGFSPKTELKIGIQKAYTWALENNKL